MGRSGRLFGEGRVYIQDGEEEEEEEAEVGMGLGIGWGIILSTPMETKQRHSYCISKLTMLLLLMFTRLQEDIQSLCMNNVMSSH